MQLLLYWEKRIIEVISELIRIAPVFIKKLIKFLIPESIIRVYREFSALHNVIKSNNYRFIENATLGHYYSPIPDMSEIRANADIIFDKSAKEIPGIIINESKQLDLVDKFVSVCGDIHFTEQNNENDRYFFDNGYFSYGDGVSLYSIMRLFKPRRIVEVGSGYSSAAMLDIGDRYFENEIEYTFIEPYPDRLLSLINAEDKKRITIYSKPVQEVPLDVYKQLNSNDILFIDSSHVAKVHSDVLHILFRILPSLSNGVLVHFHDVLWPFEYPEIWFDQGRAWNEAYVLRAFLSYNNAYEIVYFNSFMERHYGEMLQNKLPLMMKTPSSHITPGNSSLWIRKKLINK